MISFRYHYRMKNRLSNKERADIVLLGAVGKRLSYK